ncbi:hypothetical protein LCGC14_2167510 [marine sediment metagenome]|uniref:Uncharacterized protein n=1 Tax=marine sediment metagenome TaxID=412755 RepID=A0A0F9GLZ4_9ZZZZ
MKISVIGSIVLLLTLVFFLFGIIVEDMDTNYVQTNITTANVFNQSLISTFDDTAAINASVAPIQQGFQNIETADGFFQKVLNFAVVIPIAIISLPGVIFTIISIANQRAQDLMLTLAIPPEIVAVGLVALMLLILFKLAGWWQGRDI